MLRRTAGLLALIALVVLTLSCRQVAGPGSLPTESVPNGMLPAAWENLISVTSSDRAPNIMQLWFRTVPAPFGS